MPNKICPIYKTAQIIAHKGFAEAIDPLGCQCDVTACAWANDEGFCSVRSTSECLETAISIATTLIPVDKDDQEDEG